jgi:hypothetical protein
MGVIVYYTSDEETLKQLLQQTYKPVIPLPGEKEYIRERILSELTNSRDIAVIPLSKPKIMVPTLASIAGGLIGYGCWLSAVIIM